MVTSVSAVVSSRFKVYTWVNMEITDFQDVMLYSHFPTYDQLKLDQNSRKKISIQATIKVSLKVHFELHF